MTYPLSSAVSGGQPTAAAHYNNLRQDALYLGNLQADAAPLGNLLAGYIQNLTLQLLGTTRVRVPATALSPVCIVISGIPLYASANVDLPAGSAPSGAAAQWYIFATSSAGLTSFSLDVNTSAGELTGRRLIGGFYWNGSAIAPGSIYTSFYQSLNLPPAAFQVNGRLTLQTATPFSTADIAAATTLYFTPCRGNRVPLYAMGAGWSTYVLTELSISLATLGAGKVNDVFLYYTGTALALNLVEWTNTTTRAVALTTQDGMLVKNNAPDYLYLGTIAASAAGKCDDTKLLRYVWNYFNRSQRNLSVVETSDTWSYNGAWRIARNTAGNCVSMVIGIAEDPVFMQVSGEVESSAVNAALGIGVDVTNANSCQIGQQHGGTAGYMTVTLIGTYYGYPGIGVHTLNFIEVSANTVTFIGDGGFAGGAGLNGYIVA